MMGLTSVMTVLAAVVLFITISLQPVFSESTDSSCPVYSCEKKSSDTCKDEKVVMCYFTNWAFYRKGIGKYTPENIDPSLCTHILYAFSSLADNSTMISSDTWADFGNSFFKRVTDFKKKCVKILLSIGGWNDSAGDKWHNMLSNSTARNLFVKTTVQFLLKNGFDGLDLDYEYPGCPQGNLTSSYNDDKNYMIDLLKELRKAFKPYGFLLTACGSAGKEISTKCYDMSEMCKYLDYINVMTYDYNSATSAMTAADAPLRGTNGIWGVNDTMHYYMSLAGCKRCKLVLGIKIGAISFTLKDSSFPGFGKPSSGAGTAGTYTAISGFMSYYELCDKVKNGWDSGFNRINGSWATNGNQFVSYSSWIDNQVKACWVKKYKWAGVMVWTVDYDDFTNSCGCGPNPVLTHLNQQLRCRPGDCSLCY